MHLLCKICDRLIIEIESEYYNYLATFCKKDDKSLYKNFNNNKFSLDAINEILNDYISTNNKNFVFCFINCEIVVEFDSFIGKIKIDCFHITDIVNISFIYYTILFVSYIRDIIISIK